MIINIALFVLFLYTLTLFTWVFYLAAMNMKRNIKHVGLVAKLFAYPAMFIGYPLDVMFNVFVGSIFFIEMPKELLFTSRCKRHYKHPGHRGNMARFFCKNLLNGFDPSGAHCL